MQGKWYENIYSSICIFELCPLNKDKKKCCCGSFLGFPNLEKPNGIDEFQAMMNGVEVVNLHIQVQGALMFLSIQTKSPRKASPKENLRVFKRI
jgi:hypothetical protein